VTAKYCVLVGVQMHAVHFAGSDLTSRIEEVASQLRSDRRIGLAEACGFLASVANFSAMVPAGVSLGGGATMRMDGIGMSGSIGARRMARTRDAMPCAECDALC
jgi:hypothetical protein